MSTHTLDASLLEAATSESSFTEAVKALGPLFWLRSPILHALWQQALHLCCDVSVVSRCSVALLASELCRESFELYRHVGYVAWCYTLLTISNCVQVSYVCKSGAGVSCSSGCKKMEWNGMKQVCYTLVEATPRGMYPHSKPWSDEAERKQP